VTESGTVTFMAVGDVNIQRSDPLGLFGDTLGVLGEADLLIGNLEGVVSDRGAPLPGKREAGSSCVRGSVGSAPALAEAGFGAMSIANNHGMDFGAEALAHSLELLHQNGIAAAGAGPTLAAARAPAIMTRGGVRVAMLAYTSVFPASGFMATPDGPGVAVIRVSTAYETPANVPYQPGTPATTITIPNEADRGAMEEDVRLARLDADLVVVQFHWGVVGMSRPLGYMRELGRTAIDAGADLVIGNHAHVLQGIEFYREGLICYSLNHLQYRFASRLVDPSAHPFPGDTVIGLGCRLICAAVTYSQMRLRHRTILLVWVIACALTPSSYRRNFILWRFSAISRPAVVRTLLGTLSSLRSTRLPDRA